MPQSPTTFEATMLHRELSLRPDTLDLANRTFEAVWTTGAIVERRDWWGDVWEEELGLNDDEVDLSRLASGRAPYLDQHGRSGLVNAQIGRILEHRWEGEGESRVGVVRVEISDRPEVEQHVWPDIVRGITPNQSVGYFVQEAKLVQTGEDVVDRYRMTRWLPWEVSRVMSGADADAFMRSYEKGQSRTCVLIGTKPRFLRQQSRNGAVQMPMPGETTTTTEEPEKRGSEPTPDLGKVKAEAKRQEKERAAEIRTLCRAAGVGDELADKLIDDEVELDGKDGARAQILAARAERDKKTATNSSRSTSGSVSVGKDDTEKKREAITAALEHRVGARENLPEEARPFRGCRFLRMAEHWLEAHGERVMGGDEEIVRRIAAMGTQQYDRAHSSSHLPAIVADAANKVAVAAFERAPNTYQSISRGGEVSDFKASNFVSIGGGSKLQNVPRTGEVAYGRVTDRNESVALDTKGLIMPFDRRAMIDDDLSMISEVPRNLARNAMQARNEAAWILIVNNVVLGSDSTALYDASRGNIIDGNPVLDASGAGYASGRAQMLRFVDIDGNRLRLTPATLVVPPALEDVSLRLVADTTPANASDVNTVRRSIRNVVVEPILEDLPTNGLTAWYMFADPEDVPVLRHVTLQGQDGPQISVREGWSTLGMEFRVIDDFGIGAVEWRGTLRSLGTAV